MQELMVAFVMGCLAQAVKESDLITRAHDLSGLVTRRGYSSRGFDLCPRTFSGSFVEDLEGTIGEPFEKERLRELLVGILHRRGLLGEVGKIEPSFSGLMGDSANCLLVTASLAVHEEIGRSLELLESACLGEDLEVRVITGDHLTETALVLDLEEADRRVFEITSSGWGAVLRAGSATLLDGLFARIDASDAELYTKDWEVEIAHAAVVYDPVRGLSEPGLTAIVRAARASGATYLDMAIRHSQAQGPMRRQIFEPMIWMGSPEPHAAEQGKDPLPGSTVGVNESVPLLIELPLDRFTSFAGSFLLPDGKVLWIPCHVVTHAGTVSCAVEVRVNGAQRSARPSVAPAEEAEDPKPAIVHLGSHMSAGFEGPPITKLAFSSHEGFPEGWPSVIKDRDDRDSAEDLLEVLKEALPEMKSAESILADVLSPSHLFLEAPAALRKLVDDGLNTFYTPGRPFEIKGRVLGEGELLAEFTIPALTGKLSTIWSGLKGNYLFDWDVDVAGEALIANPEIDSFLDGFALKFVVRTLPSRRIQLSVNGKLHFLDGPPELKDLKYPYTPAVERIEARSLLLDETRNFDPSTPTLHFGDDHLALEITLTALG